MLLVSLFGGLLLAPFLSTSLCTFCPTFGEKDSYDRRRDVGEKANGKKLLNWPCDREELSESSLPRRLMEQVCAYRADPYLNGTLPSPFNVFSFIKKAN